MKTTTKLLAAVMTVALALFGLTNNANAQYSHMSYAQVSAYINNAVLNDIPVDPMFHGAALVGEGVQIDMVTGAVYLESDIYNPIGQFDWTKFDSIMEWTGGDVDVAIHGATSILDSYEMYYVQTGWITCNYDLMMYRSGLIIP